MRVQSGSGAALASSNAFFSSSDSSIERRLGHADELLAVVLLELLHGVLVDRVGHVDHLVALLLELLKERGVLHGGLGLAGDVVDARLALLHALKVLLERDEVLAGLGGLVAEEVGDLAPVGRVL